MINSSNLSPHSFERHSHSSICNKNVICRMNYICNLSLQTPTERKCSRVFDAFTAAASHRQSLLFSRTVVNKATNIRVHASSSNGSYQLLSVSAPPSLFLLPPTVSLSPTSTPFESFNVTRFSSLSSPLLTSSLSHPPSYTANGLLCREGTVSIDLAVNGSVTTIINEVPKASSNLIAWPDPKGEPEFWNRSPFRSNPGEGVDIVEPVHKDTGLPSSSGFSLSAPARHASVRHVSVRSNPSRRKFRVVHVAAELAPVAKVGGLGDVVSGLARASLRRGHDVLVILPYYSFLEDEVNEGAANASHTKPKGRRAAETLHNVRHFLDFDVPKGYIWDGEVKYGHLPSSAFSAMTSDGVPVILIRPKRDPGSREGVTGSRIFSGGSGIYNGGGSGSYNDIEAFLYFSRAALEFLARRQITPQVLHLHDWHSAAAAMLLWESYANVPGWCNCRVVLTLHNLENTGECTGDQFAVGAGFPSTSLATQERALDERTIGHNPERLSIIKGALVYCSAAVAVSPSFATEIARGQHVGWLRSLFQQNEIKDKLHGIINGIDTELWDPRTDPVLPANFSAEFPANFPGNRRDAPADLLYGKSLCKKYLQRGLGLPESSEVPIVAVISRLAPQKGVHLIEAGMRWCGRPDDSGGYKTADPASPPILTKAQFVLLGSGHSDRIFRDVAAADARCKKEASGRDGADVKLGEEKGMSLEAARNRSLTFSFNEALSRLIFAAADIVLVPSLYEPCGLTQLIALRYGALPVVRRTGGLSDTVFDLGSVPSATEEESSRSWIPPIEGNGFCFDGTTPRDVEEALSRAVQLYRTHKETWIQIVTKSKNGMRMECGWDAPKSQGRYEELYDKLCP
uniref:starch synthase n=1 Tax=Polytomella parva TaxID=51329 RepID=A0A7S0UW66_9CHLO|mmetsp:Transcript_20333/g.36509  ORF Transcript_20333/g.36509 Transcript_20333/m.36509 type:complete len:855 (+) Transcript_20333:146-2710(+)